MKKIKVMLFITVLLSTTNINATKIDKNKRELKSNMMEIYNRAPKETNLITGMINEGEFYGRFRVNNFNWDWNKNDTNDHSITGIGGSLLYKSASFLGFSATAGIYYSYAIANIDLSSSDELSYLKAGKDTQSRYNSANGGSNSLFVPAQYYIEYKVGNSNIKVGQQIHESFFTKSNDTKMIPNTFMGISMLNRDIPSSKLRISYFSAQKLRDHTTNHDLITFKTEDDNTLNYKWNNNDDSAVNKNLNYAAFKAAGMSSKHNMLVGDFNSKVIKNLDLTLSGNYINEIVIQAVAEAYYKLNIAGFSVTPGIRHLQQVGLTNGKISNAATLKTGTAVGYTNPNSINSALHAARVDVKLAKGIKFRYGYSYISDQADILAMWRGFPTGGFTRAMAQYNWYANTTTHMLKLNLNFDKMGLIPGFSIMTRFAMQDFDENKSAVQGDTNIFHIDIIQKLDVITKGLIMKIRAGLATDKRAGSLELAKPDASYNEFRYELNYLF